LTDATTASLLSRKPKVEKARIWARRAAPVSTPRERPGIMSFMSVRFLPNQASASSGAGFPARRARASADHLAASEHPMNRNPIAETSNRI
jgi:hypothetical protein